MALANPVQESPRRASPTQAPRSAARETSRFTNDDERWAAIERRDRTADGVFLFAVRTTGIY